MTKSKLARRETVDQSGLYARLTWFNFQLDNAISTGRRVTVDGIAAGLRALDLNRGHDAADRAVAEMFRVSDMAPGDTPHRTLAGNPYDYMRR